MNEKNDNEIIILRKRNTITDTQKELLKKVLSFVPKPKDTNINQLYTDPEEVRQRDRIGNVIISTFSVHFLH